MLCKSRNRHEGAGGLLGLLLLLGASRTAAQDATTLSELRKLHDDLCKPHHVASMADGEAAVAKLREWNLAPDALPPKERAMLLRTQTHAALAVGDPVRAAEHLKALEATSPDTYETLETAYLVAAATGDAEAGQAALKKLSDLTTGADRRQVSQRRRWIKRLGTPGPDVEISLAGGTTVSVRQRRGIILVIDFWNARDTKKEYAQALRSLFETCKNELRVQFIGVNSDDAADLEAAQALARELKYAWPQHYEGKSLRPPITHGAFEAGTPPWTVVIDGQGQYRAVGEATDPGFAYALRALLAGVAEKTGERKPGEQAGEPAGPGGVPSGQPQAGKPEPGQGDLPSNDEAEALLRQARTYIRTGFKTKAKELLEEIIRKYPGTRQAKEAQERLALLR